MEKNIYVMSDLHGQLDKYQEMLKKIGFTDETDELYILGDVLDRGYDSLGIVKEIMGKENVTLLMGNHESFALSVLWYVSLPLTEQSEDVFDEGIKETYFTWLFNGGYTTLQELHKLDVEEQRRILAFLEKLPAYAELKLGDRDFFLVHAGIEGYNPECKEQLDSMPLESFVWSSPSDFDTPFFDEPNKYIVFGHTPTLKIPGAESGKIFVKNRYIGVDCGLAFGEKYNGRLGCLRLNDMKEFYV